MGVFVTGYEFSMGVFVTGYEFSVGVFVTGYAAWVCLLQAVSSVWGVFVTGYEFSMGVFVTGYEFSVGVFVSHVEPGSQADKQGLKVGIPPPRPAFPSSVCFYIPLPPPLFYFI